MRKLWNIQFLIIIFTIVAVLLIAFQIPRPITVTANDQEIGGRPNAFKAITIELQSEQIVSGCLTYKNFLNDTWFTILDANGEHLEPSYSIVHSEQNTITFQFTAPKSGTYYVGVGNNLDWVEKFDYSYSVSSPSEQEFVPLLLIALVIIIAAVLTGVNILVNWVVPRKKLKLISVY
jgi:hypothetical protein